MSERNELIEALGSVATILGRTAYLEMRENYRLMGLPVPDPWYELSTEGKTLWDNVALAVVHQYMEHLPMLLRRKS